MNRKEQIAKLKEFAKERNYRIRFVDKARGSGDFTIFIYKGDERSYSVGFDGFNDSKYKYATFEGCVECAYRWIESQNQLIKDELKWEMNSEVRNILCKYFTEDTAVDLTECSNEIVRKLISMIK